MTQFKAIRTYKIDDDSTKSKIELMGQEELEGDVLIESSYSSINYKDALAVTGTSPILKKYPLVPGIDVSGIVVSSSSSNYKKGDQVLVTGCGFGEKQNGGLAQMAKVPENYIVPLPKNLSLKNSMIIGTAGFTAALAIHRMEQNGQTPDKGPILVSGASGGVGMIAISMLDNLGYEIIAISDKKKVHPILKELGAKKVMLNEEFEVGKRPLEKGIYGGAIDNVGGTLLEGLLRQTSYWGNIASIGLALNEKFSGTVMPHILRGVSLLGVSSTNCPMSLRRKVWHRIANDLMPKSISLIHTETVNLEGVADQCQQILNRSTFGRILVSLK